MDEVDLGLIEALQVSPRASWESLSRNLGGNAPVIRRRWERLRADGNAWMTCYSGPAATNILAVVEVVCRPGEVDAVALLLSVNHSAVNVAAATGGRDLLVVISVADMAEMRHLLTGVIGKTPGVAAARSSIVTRMFREGSRWRIGALDPYTTAAVADTSTASRSATPNSPILSRFLEFAPRIAYWLNEDGRMPVAQLAERMRIGEATARRAMTTLLDSRYLLQRVDVAQEAVGWPMGLALWLTVPASDLVRAATVIAGLGPTRLCAAVAGGESNLYVVCWLRQLADANTVEQTIISRTSAKVVERSVLLKHYKRLGHLLDNDGRHARIIHPALT